MMSLIWTASDEITYLFKEIGICTQGLKIIQDPITTKNDKDAKELEVKSGEISFEKVNFKYEKNDNIFKNKSLKIRGGSKIGLVGFSGSGKSTFANLIMRLFQIESGAIKIDGQDIAKITSDSLRRNISLIPQDPVLFHRSIIENIRYGELDAC